ncbi:response regulator [Pseudooceanicola sp. C21-150M6]|uniref:response regulator n=1 Tax=Pseudooceanicola sp. C21-150M6 TaxID=3434355 RepID=UPI003D7FF406
MDDQDYLIRERVATAQQPLLGMTILLVEDSVYASEAMRMLCLRSGARIRRADCLRSARRHLQVYRPSAAIVDLGLPDGSGIELITEMAAVRPRVPVILAISGDEAGGGQAVAAGADEFLEKPVRTLGVFQNALLKHLPEEHQPLGPRSIDPEEIRPDALSYRDDLTLMSEILGPGMTAQDLTYAARFLYGIAKSAGDDRLRDAADKVLSDMRGAGDCLARAAVLKGLIADRMASAAPI